MNKLYKTPVITSIVMLLLALLDLPAGYYTLLRIIVCGTAIYLGFIAKSITKISWVWTLGFIAILFNPFIPIHLDREMWAFIDIIVGFVFFAGVFALSGEGATKSIFKTKAFRIFRKIALVIFLCILAVVVLKVTISSVKYCLKKKPKVPEGYILEERRQPVDLLEHFDIKTARPVDGSFIETYSKGEIIIVGSYRDGKEDGIWKIYDKYGYLRAEKKYEKGVLVDEVKVFNENGNLIRQYPCREGKIIGEIDLSDTTHVSDYDIATREAVSFVNMNYEDENIKAKLLPPYLDNKERLIFEIDIEAVNKTAIIRNIVSGTLFRVNLKDNYNNPISISCSAPYSSLRFGDKRKITISSYELPLRNAIYFYLTIHKDTIGNLNDINFLFPTSFIKE